MHLLSTRHPLLDFSLVIGSDLLPGLRSWYNGPRLLAEVHVTLVPRPGEPPVGSAVAPDAMPSRCTVLPDSAHGAARLATEMSSTAARGLRAAGVSVEGLLPVRGSPSLQHITRQQLNLCSGAHR